ncbi:MAG: hypothetical protein WB755_02705 [Terriglobales bacterium]|jgi:hypothetical protein
MKSVKIAITVVSLVTLLFACPTSVSCPADRAEMYKVGDDYTGLTHLAIYEHRTSAGVTHQITVSCEK